MNESIRIEQVTGNIPRSTVHVSESLEPQGEGMACDLHYHDDIELLPVFAGEFIANVDGRDLIANAGEVIFINAGVPHWTRRRVGGVVTGLIQFKENDFLNHEITKIIKYSARFKNLSNESAVVIKDRDFFAIVKEILTEVTEKKPAYDIYVRAGIYRVLGHLYRHGVLADSEEMYNNKEVQKILPILSYINKNYGEDITLIDMSGMLGFDPSYFCRLFKSATGATFTEYLNFVRICRAEKLLSRTSKSVLEISEEVGFSSVSYFNRIFKRFKNCPPGTYRSATYANI